MKTPLPPLGTLQGLFHYNPLTGSLTYLTDRGPRKAGEPAGRTVNGRWYVFVDGRYYPATEVAMALHRQRDHCPLWVHTINGDYNDIKIANLVLAEDDPNPITAKRRPRTKTRKQKPGSLRARDKYIERHGTKWRASFYKGGTVYYIGLFDSKLNARKARDEAAASGLSPAQARAYALDTVPQETRERKNKLNRFNGDEEREYCPPVGVSKVLLSDAILRARVSELDLRRKRFRTIEPGQVFYFDGRWYVKRSSKTAARADTDRKLPLKYFSGVSMIRVFRDINQPFINGPPPVPLFTH